MEKAFNVKVNDLKKNFINVNVRNSYTRIQRDAQTNIRRAQRIANDLVRKFGPESRGSFNYFCKCAYRLSEATIWECYEASCSPKVSNKLAYFLAITKAQPRMI